MTQSTTTSAARPTVSRNNRSTASARPPPIHCQGRRGGYGSAAKAETQDAKSASVTPAPDTGKLPLVSDGRAVTSRDARWKVVGDELVQSNSAGHHSLVFGEASWTDYDMYVELKKSNGPNSGAGVLFRAQNLGNCNGFRYGVYSEARYAEIYRTVTGKWSGRWAGGSLRYKLRPLEYEQWHQILVVVRGETVACWFDGVCLLRGTDNRFAAGKIGLTTHNGAFSFRGIKVTDPAGRVLWQGLPKVEGAPTASVEPFGVERADLIEPRSHWVAESTEKRFILENDVWVQYKGNKRQSVFYETARTADYVQLNTKGSIAVRLYDGYHTIRWKDVDWHRPDEKGKASSVGFWRDGSYAEGAGSLPMPPASSPGPPVPTIGPDAKKSRVIGSTGHVA